MTPGYTGDMTPEERFWTKVDTSGGPNACWEWTGCRNEKRGGHGMFRHEGRSWQASRIAWWFANRQRPERGQVIRHKCDNPPCCNPAHLESGTQRDNIRDMVVRGRGWWDRATHCKNDHEWTDENTKWVTKAGRPSRNCVACLEAMKPIRAERAKLKYRQEHNLL
jgi:hypothetical protein